MRNEKGMEIVYLLVNGEYHGVERETLRKTLPVLSG